MDATNRPADSIDDAWVAGLCTREAISALAKALRAAHRLPADSPMRVASQLELVRAVRKALVHGPVAVRLGADGEVDEPTAVAQGRADQSDLILVDADAAALRTLVDTFAATGTVPGALVGIHRPAARSDR